MLEYAEREDIIDKNYYRMLGIYYTMGNAEIEVLDSRGDPLRETLHQIRSFLKDRIGEVFPPRTAGVMSAMLVGDRSLMEAEDSDRFRMAGVSHILVISGLHITMMAEAFYWILCHLAVVLPAGRWGLPGMPDQAEREDPGTVREKYREGYMPDQSEGRRRKERPDHPAGSAREQAS